jgi:hypothetical protein
MRTITLKELVFEELNRQLAEEGRDVQVVAERPRPRLVAERDEVVVPLRANQRRNGNEAI